MLYIIIRLNNIQSDQRLKGQERIRHVVLTRGDRNSKSFTITLQTKTDKQTNKRTKQLVFEAPLRGRTVPLSVFAPRVKKKTPGRSGQQSSGQTPTPPPKKTKEKYGSMTFRQSPLNAYKNIKAYLNNKQKQIHKILYHNILLGGGGGAGVTCLRFCFLR